MAQSKETIQSGDQHSARKPLLHTLRPLDMPLGSTDVLRTQHIKVVTTCIDAHIEEAAELLVAMGDALRAQGVRRIDDPRVSAEFREVWQELVESRAFEVLSDAQRRVLIGLVARPRAQAVEVVARVTERPRDAANRDAHGVPRRPPHRGRDVPAVPGVP